MKQINTATLGVTKKVEIDGHPYVVRRMGAGESLASSQIIRRMSILEKKKKITDEESDELLELGLRYINAIAALFDDGVNGVKAKAMIGSLSQDEIVLMMKQIWGESGPAQANS